MVQISNFLDNPYTLKNEMHIVNFSILTPEQTKHFPLVNPTSVWHYLSDNHDDAILFKNSPLITTKTDEVNETYCFPTPQKPGNEREHMPIQTLILNKKRELEEIEQLNPLKDLDSRHQFLSNFGWTDSTLQPEVKQVIKDLLVDFQDNFSRHCFDIGISRVQSTTHTFRQQACL